jgi:hypothetical protein
MRRNETLSRSDHGRKTALHIRSSAAVEHAVLHDGLEWIGLPLLTRTGWHNIRMAGEAQQRPLTVFCPDVFYWTERHALDFEPECLEPFRNDL